MRRVGLAHGSVTTNPGTEPRRLRRGAAPAPVLPGAPPGLPLDDSDAETLRPPVPGGGERPRRRARPSCGPFDEAELAADDPAPLRVCLVGFLVASAQR